MANELATVTPIEIPAIPTGEFHEPNFWRKIRRAAMRLTREGLEQALTLYYAAKRPETPGWAKATVYAALAYFILPIDSIPDVTPGLGYSDDLMILAAAVSSIAAHINDEVRRAAADKVNQLLGTRGDRSQGDRSQG